MLLSSLKINTEDGSQFKLQSSKLVKYIVLTSIEEAKNARKSSKQEGREKGCNQEQASWRKKKEEKDSQGKLLYLHLQSPEAGPPRDWYFQQSYEHHELIRQRHLREDCYRGIAFGSVQQEAHYHQSGNPDCCSSLASR